MASKIENRPPRTPMWPWGGPGLVREKLVTRTQFDRARKNKKLGDPKNPSLASSALLESIGPAHSAEELRLPLPPTPEGHDGDRQERYDAQNLDAAVARADPEESQALERN